MTIDEARKALTNLEGTGNDHSLWADQAVKTFVDAHIVNGSGNGDYGWGQCMTREEVVAVLYNLVAKLGFLCKLG